MPSADPQRVDTAAPGDPAPTTRYIASGAEIPSNPNAPANVSWVARTSESRAAERSGWAGSTTLASR
jgi:hypothetical protein